jgi:hypothetical protein
MGDVFINLKDPGARRTVRKRDAYARCLLQSATWIGQPFQPAKKSRRSEENECSAYISWEESTWSREEKQSKAGKVRPDQIGKVQSSPINLKEKWAERP